MQPRTRTLGRAAKVIGLAVTALIPGALKRVMLRSLFGFRIGARVRIGVAYFDCAELTIEDDATVGHGVLFKNVGSVRIGKHAVVGPLNMFRGGDRIDLGDYTQVLRLNVINAIPHHDCFGVLDSTFSLGHGAVIASSHWIDFTDRVSIGRRSMLGGRNSSIWTHNRRRAAPVKIGDFCYMGSETRIAPGVALPDCSIVAMGSVISSAFQTPFTFIGGAPARITRRLTEDDGDTLFGKTRWDLPDEPVPSIPVVDAVSDATAMAVRARAVADRVEGGNIEEHVRRLVAQAGRIRPDEVELHRPLSEQGVDSLQLIVLRETTESALSVQFSDHTWIDMTTPALIASYVAASHPAAGENAARDADAAPVASRHVATTTMISPELACDELEVGMPLTGRNNLAETPLLQRLGDQRWRHMSEVMGLQSKNIVDDQGERLYATFFFVETAFPPEKPMASFGENDRFKVVSTMARYGTSMLDGVAFLMPGDYSVGDSAPFTSLQAAVDAGVPAVRLSNIFVKQFAGAEWLKKGRPAHPGFVRIPALSNAPDSYALVKNAEKSGYFNRPEDSWIALTDGPVRREYRLVPDRDLNGVGLVYFANYPMFLDICERDVLLSGAVTLTDELVDRRTLVRRKSAYLNNASARDTLLVEIEPWVEVRVETASDAATVRLHVNSRMYRRSDERLMMVSTAEKVINGASFASLRLPPHVARTRPNAVHRPS